MLCRMSKDELVQILKQAVGFARAGNHDDCYRCYHYLFAQPDFAEHRPEDQRQALRLMVHAKAPPGGPSQPMLDAHRAAIVPLTELVSVYDEPADYEMLGMSHLLIGNVEAASRMYRAGLAIERERNPASDLCGTLMRRVSEL
jgi:hypothetical protein